MTPKKQREVKSAFDKLMNTEEGKKASDKFMDVFDDIDIPESKKGFFRYYDTLQSSEAVELLEELLHFETEEHLINANRERNLLDFIKFEIERHKRRQKNIIQPETNATHREVIIAYNYKVEAGIAEPQKATYWLHERGKNARIQAYTATKGNKNNKKYKPPTPNELKTVIELLKDYPPAQKIAINKLSELESL
jgi:hypothetical protein